MKVRIYFRIILDQVKSIGRSMYDWLYSRVGGKCNFRSIFETKYQRDKVHEFISELEILKDEKLSIKKPSLLRDGF